jgi:hypothetical protein
MSFYAENPTKVAHDVTYNLVSFDSTTEFDKLSLGTKHVKEFVNHVRIVSQSSDVEKHSAMTQILDG